MSSYLENLPCIVGNLGEEVTIIHEFVLLATDIEGGIRLTITSLLTGDVQTVDIMDGHTPVKGVDYWTEEDIASLNIPTDEHINELIDSALGVIENGTY